MKNSRGARSDQRRCWNHAIEPLIVNFIPRYSVQSLDVCCAEGETSLPIRDLIMHPEPAMQPNKTPKPNTPQSTSFASVYWYFLQLVRHPSSLPFYFGFQAAPWAQDNLLVSRTGKSL
jgi:hypothetical protein